jgi:hypothetical protein
MNIRNIYRGRPLKRAKKGKPWAKLWNKAQLDNENPITVIYAHDAKRVSTLSTTSELPTEKNNLLLT